MRYIITNALMIAMAVAFIFAFWMSKPASPYWGLYEPNVNIRIAEYVFFGCIIGFGIYNLKKGEYYGSL